MLLRTWPTRCILQRRYSAAVPITAAVAELQRDAQTREGAAAGRADEGGRTVADAKLLVRDEPMANNDEVCCCGDDGEGGRGV